MRVSIIVPTIVSMALPCGLAAAQAAPLVLEGDAIPGVGLVTDVREVVVNDQGAWLLLLETDHPDPLANEVLLRDGAVYLREGDPGSPPSGEKELWDDSSWIHSLGLTDAGDVYLAASQGVYFGTTPVALRGQPCGAPGLQPGTKYGAFHDAEMNDARQILCRVLLKLPGAGAGQLDALLKLSVDASGALLSETLVAKEGDVLSGLPAAASFASADDGFALDEAGNALFSVPTAMLLGAEPQAVESEQSPIFGGLWADLWSWPADLSGAGDQVFAGITTKGSLITWNGIQFVRQGDVLPSIAPFELEGQGSLHESGKVFVADAGQVIWYGEWNDPDETRDSGFFRNHALLVQEGVSLAAGQRLDTFGAGLCCEFCCESFDFHASDDGRYLAFAAELEDGREGAFLLDLVPSAEPHVGCTGNQGTLSLLSTPKLGPPLPVLFGNPQTPAPAAYLGVSTAPAAGWPPCGIPLGSAGELLIAAPAAVFGPAFWAIPGVQATLYVPMPIDLSLVGATLYAQAIFADLEGLAPAEPLRLTNAYELVVGLPGLP